MAQPIEHLQAKLERADEHLRDIEARVKTFLGREPDRIVVADYDTPEAKAFRRRQAERRVDPTLCVVVGEMLYQMRSSLDHLVCMLVRKDRNATTNKTQFPIFPYKPAKKDEVAGYERQVEGITRREVRAFIERVQPYNRGDRRHTDPLAILKVLNNTDKHSALVTHVAKARESPLVRLAPKSDAQRISLLVEIGGETFSVVDVKNQLVTEVAFAQFGERFRNREVITGLRNIRLYLPKVVYPLVGFLK